MASSLRKQLQSARRHLQALADNAALKSPTGYLEQRAKTVELLENRLQAGFDRNISNKRHRFVELTAKLDAMSPLKVLTRGYAIAQTADGAVLRSKEQVTAGDTISVDVSDGRIYAAVLPGEE